jgi:hypothetical protein
MMEAVRTSETSVDNHFTRQYITEDNSEHHARRRENLKSHMKNKFYKWISVFFRQTLSTVVIVCRLVDNALSAIQTV